MNQFTRTSTLEGSLDGFKHIICRGVLFFLLFSCLAGVFGFSSPINTSPHVFFLYTLCCIFSDVALKECWLTPRRLVVRIAAVHLPCVICTSGTDNVILTRTSQVKALNVFTWVQFKSYCPEVHPRDHGRYGLLISNLVKDQIPSAHFVLFRPTNKLKWTIFYEL